MYACGRSTATRQEGTRWQASTFHVELGSLCIVQPFETTVRLLGFHVGVHLDALQRLVDVAVVAAGEIRTLWITTGPEQLFQQIVQSSA